LSAPDSQAYVESIFPLWLGNKCTLQRTETVPVGGHIAEIKQKRVDGIQRTWNSFGEISPRSRKKLSCWQK